MRSLKIFIKNSNIERKLVITSKAYKIQTTWPKMIKFWYKKPSKNSRSMASLSKSLKESGISGWWPGIRNKQYLRWPQIQLRKARKDGCNCKYMKEIMLYLLLGSYMNPSLLKDESLWSSHCNRGLKFTDKILTTETVKLNKILMTEVNALLRCFIWVGCLW